MANIISLSLAKLLGQTALTPLRDRLEALEAEAMAKDADFRAKREWVTQARDKETTAESRLAYVRNSAAELGKQVDPDLLAREQAEFEKAKRHARHAQQELTKAADAKRDTERLFEACARYVNGLGDRLDVVETSPPRGQDSVEGIAAARAQMAKHTEARRGIAKAQQGIEDALAQVTGQIESMRAEELVQVTFHNGRPTVRFELAKVDAQPANGGYIPYAPNFVPHFVNAHFDELLASAKAQVERHYANHVPISLSAKEKAKRLADADAKILAAERIECSIIWNLRARGQDVPFRPETTPAAVLGVA